MTTPRRVPLVLALFAMLIGLLVAVPQAPAVAAAPVQPVPRTLAGWDAGNIISDDVFADRGSMSPTAIQGFLNSKVPRCQSGYTCLKDYRMSTTTRPADAVCPEPYNGSPNEPVADIIWKVAQACRVNPQVLIVMLQKEQGLVTHTWPSDWRYTIAMGQGCPDTAACDTQYYGFFNQVYGAAWQLRRYANPPGTSAFFTWYAPGRTWNIRWSPNAACGSSPVYIANQATANLYYYTPYQPNAAALAAGTGEGDGCSAYGNRNFYNYFTDWFGSTRSAGGGAVQAQYNELGGAAGFLGRAVNDIACNLVGGGCFQEYQNGVIYWSPSTGAWALSGPTRAVWNARDFERGIGYPTGPGRCFTALGFCLQDFQRGAIYQWSAGAFIMEGGIRGEWNRLDYERGMGLPITAQRCGLEGGGCFQDFERGAIYASPAGVFALKGVIRTAWSALDFERGLGYPSSSQRCGLADGACFQDFQKGVVYSSTSGTFSIRGALRTAWWNLDYERGMGYPTAEQSCDTSGNCTQSFRNGTLAVSSAGGWAVSGAILGAWQAAGAGSGAMGYPVGPRRCLAGGTCYQDFAQGVYYETSVGTFPITGAIRAEWNRLDYERGMGLPTAAPVCAQGGGCSQTFANGMIHWSAATGAHATSGAVLTAWRAQGLETGAFGYPIADQVCTASGCTQRFQGGTLPSA